MVARQDVEFVLEIQDRSRGDGGDITTRETRRGEATPCSVLYLMTSLSKFTFKLRPYLFGFRIISFYLFPGRAGVLRLPRFCVLEGRLIGGGGQLTTDRVWGHPTTDAPNSAASAG